MWFEVEAVLFDIDGTLVDSKAAVERTWRAWAEKYRIDRGRAGRRQSPGRASIRRLDYPAGVKSGLAEGAAGCGAAAADFASDVNPGFVGGVGELDDVLFGQAVAAGHDDPERVAEQRA